MGELFKSKPEIGREAVGRGRLAGGWNLVSRVRSTGGASTSSSSQFSVAFGSFQVGGGGISVQPLTVLLISFLLCSNAISMSIAPLESQVSMW